MFLRSMLLVVTALIGSGIAVDGQEHVVLHGQVIDASSREPLQGVLVSAPLAGLSVLTDSLGDFSLSMIEDQGYELVSTSGTYKLLKRSGVPCEMVYKIADGARPNVLDIVKNRQVHLIINTPSGRGARTDEGRIRGAASVLNIPCITTVSGATALVQALEAYRRGPLNVCSLQEYHARNRELATLQPPQR